MGEFLASSGGFAGSAGERVDKPVNCGDHLGERGNNAADPTGSAEHLTAGAGDLREARDERGRSAGEQREAREERRGSAEEQREYREERGKSVGERGKSRGDLTERGKDQGLGTNSVDI